MLIALVPVEQDEECPFCGTIVPQGKCACSGCGAVHESDAPGCGGIITVFIGIFVLLLFMGAGENALILSLVITFGLAFYISFTGGFGGSWTLRL